MIHLILGGARSGKSRHAQTLAEAFAGELVFIATGEAFDTEMADRIARHQADRGPRWRTIEAPLALADAIRDAAAPDRLLLVDCLTLWASNLMHANRDVAAETAELITALRAASAPVLLVANEVGLGIVPGNALARAFRDTAGRMNQMIAAAADQVTFVAAGLPMRLK
ncbi:bifunctional adenosylcobinamide kinase/adenosylcobinamide-phosphate guanylyltransferase [Sphingopyxis sp. DBS4]|uniref:bifunctional adenosylcobinamide kinase/adenosylcobinamide-phosphate guanylyltransferase n=1 Tax=Sphingopyxis sp. DBS4 TaxID=2968500 RepID=UPI00214CB29F|nr:bifunctional adenosylcobinamide kinase/adenosylcobinamide-phosphate guanylyltransferase [Sphingopyxis sp. DBS4]